MDEAEFLDRTRRVAALDERRTDLSVRHGNAAVAHAIDHAQKCSVSAYGEGVSGRPGSIYGQVLLACALAEEDEFRFFAPSDVREPLSRILHKPCTTAVFARHSERLLRGLSEGAVRAGDLRPRN